MDLLETPILLRNFAGQLRAFLNVCPHRHSRLTSLPKGNAEKLRCQYHGWEYNADGRTGKIPDAKAFRPWDRENSCLQPFQLETCGEVVFINLSLTAPPLREWLGPLWECWAPGFGGAYRYTTTWEQDFPCNWKVVVENSLESYHLPLIHPKTFGDFPTEENSWHELDANYTTYKTMVPRDFFGRRQAWLVRTLGQTDTMEYWHHVRHPHITYSSLDVHRLMMCVFPLSATTCRYRSILFTLRGHKRGPIAWGLSRFLRPIVVGVAKRVFREDGGLYTEIQQGLSASPHRGVIGTREERIYYFQEFVLNQCRGARELPQVELPATSSETDDSRCVPNGTKSV
jgi:phenylpropionate dioxygenase-like ring-hydroxylating dioxygenase large terminal subunit